MASAGFVPRKRKYGWKDLINLIKKGKGKSVAIPQNIVDDLLEFCQTTECFSVTCNEISSHHGLLVIESMGINAVPVI